MRDKSLGIFQGGWSKTVKLFTLLVFFLFFVPIAYGGSTSTVDNSQNRNNVEPNETAVLGQENVEKRMLRQVSIHLRGATEYETVEIFNILLNSLPLVENVERIRMIISPSRPGQCITSWLVMTYQEDTFAIESQLYGSIKQLDPEGSNDILGGLFFQATSDDIELSKKILPVAATVDDLNFALEIVRGPIHYIHRNNDGLLYAGFD